MIMQEQNFGEILPDGIYSTTGDTPADDSIDWHIGDTLSNCQEFTAIFSGKPLNSITLESVLKYKIEDYQAYKAAAEVQDVTPIPFNQFVLGCQMFREPENEN